MTIRIETGDCIEVMRSLPDCLRVNCCVTSPPYFGLRDYGHAGQIGLEKTPAEYVSRLVEVFRAVRDRLEDDGTLWLNLGDSYGGKSLLGIPWRVAFALQADGWYLRSDIIWHKPNPMPESVTDRPTKAHEYMFLLAKSRTYYYDAESVEEKSEPSSGGFQSRAEKGLTVHHSEGYGGNGETGQAKGRGGFTAFTGKRNRRTVWTVATQPFSGAHFATFPPDLIEPCILAGCPVGGTVLDPFGGAGTTGLVADRLQRNALLIELNPEYAEMARNRIINDAPLFAAVI
jgi:DNA modification methylase